MHKLLRLSILLLVLAGCSSKADWQTHDQPDEKFKIKFPAKPKMTETVEKDGATELTVRVWETELNGCHYGVAVVHYPFPVDEAKSLAGAVAGAEKSMKAKESQRSPIKLGPDNGLSYEAESDDHTKYRGRTYLVYIPGQKRDSTLYQIISSEPPGRTADANQFLESFELTKP